MDISVYFFDNVAVSSISINGATLEEALSAIKAFGFGENERVEDSDKIRIKELEMTIKTLEEHEAYCQTRYKALSENNDILEDAVNEWKDKYAIECQNNDAIKKSYDELVKDFNDLVKERDDAKYLYENTTKAYDELHIKLEETIRELNECKEIASDRDELKVENDKLKMALVGAKTTCATLEQDKFFWKNRWESEFEEGVRLKKELEKWQPKSES